MRIAAGDGRTTRSVLAQDLAQIVRASVAGRPMARADRARRGSPAWQRACRRSPWTLAGQHRRRRCGPALLGAEGRTAAHLERAAATCAWWPRRSGLERLAVKSSKPSATPDGLRAAIVQTAYKVKVKGVATPSRLRSALAAVALQRAFGNQIRPPCGQDRAAGAGGTSTWLRSLPDPARLRHRHPPDRRAGGRAPWYQVGRSRSAAARRVLPFLCRGWSRPTTSPRVCLRNRKRRRHSCRHRLPSSAVGPTFPGSCSGSAPARRGTRAGLGRQPQGLHLPRLARAGASSAPDWGLSEIEFKCMLIEAHRAGSLALANADLKDHSNIEGRAGVRRRLQERRVPFRPRRRLRPRPAEQPTARLRYHAHRG